MKSIKKAVAFLLLFSTLFSLFSCAKTFDEKDSSSGSDVFSDNSGSASQNQNGSADSTDKDDPSSPSKDKEPAMQVEQWLANEITFKSSKTYTDPVYNVTLDVVFKNSKNNELLTVPAFWDGGTTWKVRFALTELGEWKYYTRCSDKTNTGLHSMSGTVDCVAYKGDLPMYKHGFVKTKSGTRYFMHDDGTPFFYLGDTHWTLPIEDYDGAGLSTSDTGFYSFGISQNVATQNNITSQFKYTMDYRAKQGYTVIQSQPLGIYTGKTGNSWIGDANGSIFDYGVNDAMLAKFQELDKYFAYIAQKGFLHANSQLGYPEELIESYNDNTIDEKKIDMLCRYWVARYCAYPVLWTTTQEGDNDYYGWDGCTTQTNPWIIVMNSIAKYDPYDHPSSCHQENTDNTRVNNSIFAKEDAHSWYASQWCARYPAGTTPDWGMLKEYWNNPGSKPVVNYEARYDHFWAGTDNARAQVWISFLNGQMGFGYGAQPFCNLCWAQNSLKKDGQPVTEGSFDGETYKLNITWLEGLKLDAGQQITYAKKFLEKFEWWKLTPCFNGNSYYSPSGTNYSVATIGKELYVGYFYGPTTNNLGSFTSMQNGTYEIGWMNCYTGEFTTPTQVSITNGTYNIPNKPSASDWAIYAKRV